MPPSSSRPSFASAWHPIAPGLLCLLVLAPTAAWGWRALVDAARPVASAHWPAVAALVAAAAVAALTLLTMALGVLRQRAAVRLAALQYGADDQVRRLEGLIDQIAEAVVVVDGQGRIERLNPAAGRLLGLSPASARGSDFANVLAPQTSAPPPAVHRLPHNCRARLMLRQADGRTLPADLSVGSLGTARVLLLRDRSDGDAVAACLAQSATALHEADQLRQAVFQHAAMGLLVADVQGLIRAVNPAAERLLGRRAVDLVGQATLSSLHDPEDLPVLAEVLRHHLADARSGLSRLPALRGRGLERTLHLRHAQGHRVPISATVSALHDAQGQVSGFLCIASDITERLRWAEQLAHRASHDDLTGLAKRELLERELALAIDPASPGRGPVAVLFIDLDGFKAINDAHGHATGDAVLREVARRLRGGVREQDLVARLGGDEFVVLLHTAAPLPVADQLRTTLARPMAVNGLSLQVGASIGVARHPENGRDVAALLRAADAGMYAAKRARPRAARLTLSAEPAPRQPMRQGDPSTH